MTKMLGILTAIGLLLAADAGLARESAHGAEGVQAVAERCAAALVHGDAVALEKELVPGAALFALRSDADGDALERPALGEIVALVARTDGYPSPPILVSELLDVLPRIASARIGCGGREHFLQLSLDDAQWRVRALLSVEASGESTLDEPALERVGLDYLSAFLDTRPALLEGAVAPALAKYGYYGDADSASMRGMAMSYAQLLELAGKLYGADRPAPAGPRLCEVRSRRGAAGLLRVVGPWGVDLVLAGRVGGRWQALSILWQSPPPEQGLVVAGLRPADAVRATCPFSGKAIAADSLCLYRGRVVGFCNPGCRDKFARTPQAWLAQLPELRQ